MGRGIAKPARADEGIVEWAAAALAVGPFAAATAPRVLPLDALARAIGLDGVSALYRARPWLATAALAPAAWLALSRRRGRGARAAAAALGVLLAAEAAAALRARATLARAPGRELSAAEAQRVLAPEDEVLGVELNGEARAYPLAVFGAPHAIHDIVGGVPLVPTYCRGTGAAIAFRDEAAGGPLALEAIGSLGGNVVFYDRRTRGIVRQLEARIAAGPYAGAPIETIPLTLTTWRIWRTFFPHSTALTAEPSLLARLARRIGLAPAVARGGRGAGEAAPPLRMAPVEPGAAPGSENGRLPAGERVLGVAARGWAKAYARLALAERRVIEDSMHGLPIVVLYDADHDIARAFDRRLDGRALSLRPELHADSIAVTPAGEAGEMPSRLDVMGRFIEGPLAGRRLEPVPCQVDKVVWAAWAATRPETEAVAGGVPARG